MIRVIESSVVGKHHDPALCEDMIFGGTDFVAVVDGATDKSGAKYDGVSGGRLAASVIVEELSRLPAEIDARAATDRITHALSAAVPDSPADGPSAAVAIYSRQRREVWQVGDVSFSPIGPQLRAPTRKAVDEVASGVRAAMSVTLLEAGTDLSAMRESDPGRAVIIPLLREQFRLRNQNCPWSYGAIDGSPVPPNKIEVSPIGAGVQEIVIYSDGYPKAYRSLAEAEADLDRLLRLDPLCIGQLCSTKGWRPGQRSFDDRAFIRFTV